MNDLVISFYHCHPTEHGVSITVGKAGHIRYTLVERVLRRFRQWITITAGEFRCAAERMFRRRPVALMPCRVSLLACVGGLRL